LGANAVMFLMMGGFIGMFFLGALYMQRVLGYGPIEVGLAFLPVAIAVGALSLGFSERLNIRFGAGNVVLPGLALGAAGLALLTRAPVDADYVTDILPAMLLVGVGAGLAFPALMTLAMSGVTASDSGLASGLANTTQQVGGALGLSILASLATSRTEDRIAEGVSTASALTSGYHLAFGLAALFVASAIPLAAAALSRRAPAPAPVEAVSATETPQPLIPLIPAVSTRRCP
jgi:Major Facilitator Superfamily